MSKLYNSSDNNNQFVDRDRNGEIIRKYQPSPPQELLNIVYDYLRESIAKCKWKIAADVGCRFGQLTNSLANQFDHVYGFDTNEMRINEAKKKPHPSNVTYDVLSADDLSTLSKRSIQLVTASQCVHRFDINKFLKEVDRVLEPNGVIAIIGTNCDQIIDLSHPEDNQLSQLMIELSLNTQLLQFQKEKISMLIDQYDRVNFPVTYESSSCDGFIYAKDVTAADLSHVISTWSCIEQLRNKDIESAKMIVQEFESKVRQIVGHNDLRKVHLVLQTPFFLIMGRKISYD